MKSHKPHQILIKFLLRIDFFYLLLIVIFTLLQAGVVNSLNFPVRWNFIIKFLYWIIFFKAGLDLLFLVLRKSDYGDQEWRYQKNVNNYEFWQQKKLTIVAILIIVSLISFSQLISIKQSFTLFQLNLTFLLISVFLMFRDYGNFRYYSELLDAFFITFMIPYLVNILHAVPSNRLFIFSTLPFLFFVCAVFIMRSIKNHLINYPRMRSGIILLLDVRTIFVLVISLMCAGFITIFSLQIMGLGVSLMPEILISIPVGAGAVWYIRNTYMKNGGNFNAAFFLSHFLLFLILIIVLLNTIVN